MPKQTVGKLQQIGVGQETNVYHGPYKMPWFDRGGYCLMC